MCRYVCQCRHAHCVRAPQGCFVLGWPCTKHNDPAEFDFTVGDIKSRDADWAVVRKKLRQVIEITNRRRLPASKSKALPIFLRNTLARLATGARHDIPISMDWFQIQQGELTKPLEKWRSTKFEIECAQLREFFDHETEVPPPSQMMVAAEPADPRIPREPSMSGMTLGSAFNSDTSTATQNDRELSQRSSNMTIFPEDDNADVSGKDNLRDLRPFEKPPAWKPSAPEISLLLKTIILEDDGSPASPAFSDDSMEDLEKPDPFRHRERHRTFYALEENRSRVTLGSLECVSQFAQSAIALDELVEAVPLSRVTETDENSQCNGSACNSLEIRTDSPVTSSRYPYSKHVHRHDYDPAQDSNQVRSTPDSLHGRYLTVYDGPRHTPTSTQLPPLTGCGADAAHQSFAEDSDSDSSLDSADIRYMQQLSRRNFKKQSPAAGPERKAKTADLRALPQRSRAAEYTTDVFLQLAEEIM